MTTMTAPTTGPQLTNVSGMSVEDAVDAVIARSVAMGASDLFMVTNEQHVAAEVRHLGLMRTIAIIDAATTSPFAQLSMIPLLTLIAIYAPAGHRATWFALMASLMNLALVAGALQTKYLNEIFVVSRGNYENIPYIVGICLVAGFVVPVAAILILGRRIR